MPAYPLLLSFLLYPVTQGSQSLEPFILTLVLAVPFVDLIIIASIGLPKIPAKSSPDLSFSLSVISSNHFPPFVCTQYISFPAFASCPHCIASKTRNNLSIHSCIVLCVYYVWEPFIRICLIFYIYF